MSSAGQAMDPVMALAAQQQAQTAAPQQGVDPVQALAMGQAQNPIVNPQQHTSSTQMPLGAAIHSYLGNIYQGLHDIPQSIGELGARGLDAVGATHGAYPALHGAFQDMNAIATPDQTSRYAKGGRALGEMIGTLPTAALAPVSGGGVLAAGANSALQGGLSALLTSNNSSDPLTTQAAKGMALGGVLSGGMNAAAKGASPTISKAVQMLSDNGVPLTPGQILGGGFKRAEDSATSIPVLGDLIRSRQRDSVLGFNSAIANKALEPIGETLPAGKSGHAAVDYVSERLGNAYDRLLPSISALPDQQFLQGVSDLKQFGKDQYLLTGEKAGQLGSIIDSHVTGKLNGSQPLTGEELKDIQSNLGFQARKFSKSPSPDDQSLADAIVDLRGHVNDLIARQNPAQAPELNNINTGYANYIRLNKAAQSAKDGVFSPLQFAGAVKSTTPNKSTVGLGKALLQDFSSAGAEVLPTSVPDSGTPLRHAWQIAAASLLGHNLLPEGAEHALAAAAPLAAGIGGLYTKPGATLAATLLMKRPASAKAIGKLLQAAPAGAIAGPLSAQLGTAN